LRNLDLIEVEKNLYSDEKYQLNDDQLEQAQKSFDFLQHFSEDKLIYGINTGFGPMAQYRIRKDQLKDLQYNLIRSHANGLGEYFPDLYSHATMISRLHSLSMGYSAASPDVLKSLEAFIRNSVYPLIPAHGGVGASGDLVQLAHLGQALIGEGRVRYRGEERDTKTLLRELNIAPVDLKLRDGLAILNGTSCMTGIGILNVIRAKRLMKWSIAAASLLNEITESYSDAFSETLNAAKKHTGQHQVAREMRKLLIDSKLIRKRPEHLFNGDEIKDTYFFTDKIQEYYSLRCVPQIIGPIYDAIENAEIVVINELNSASDNPIVCMSERDVLHGGNFHGDYVSFEMDKLKIGITKLSILLERQINYLLNPALNGKFPAFLNKGIPGLNYGLQGVQFTAVSNAAENQSLSFPASIHSISNNGDNQDVVSMGTNASWMTKRVIDNGFEILSIKMLTLAHALEIKGNYEKVSSAGISLLEQIRQEIPDFKEDTSYSVHLRKLIKKLDQ
jgi:histidine ammonia-lyase